MKPVVIEIDVADCVEELEAAGADVSSQDVAIREQMGNRRTSRQMGRHLVAGREMGMAPANILSPNKVLLNTGAASEWYGRVKDRMVSVEVDGKSIRVREFVGPVSEDDPPGDERFVRYDDPEAVRRALAYLSDAVPNLVHSRLALIAVAGGDVHNAATRLCERVMADAEELTEEPLMS